jgi:exopolyphosphatase / guanosine-5'-triphosphate,3'-diphosphate pyrophosphatase
MAEQSRAPRTLAALDIGTNSFHLVVARVQGNGYDVVTRAREAIRLGHGGDGADGAMRQLQPDAIERGIGALQRMKHLADSHGAAVRAVATSAVREADNAAEFIERARCEAGIDVEVISGVDEARLIYLGVLHAIPEFRQRLMLVDVGGGSTEVLIGEAGVALAARSFKLGAVRLTDRFFPGGALTSQGFLECSAYAGSVLAPFREQVRELGFDVAVVSSGTAETISKMVAARRGGQSQSMLNRFEFSRNELDAIVDELTSHATTAERAHVAGLSAERADIIVAGALVLQRVAATFGIDSLTFSDGALREGVLLDTIAYRGEPNNAANNSANSSGRSP